MLIRRNPPPPGGTNAGAWPGPTNTGVPAGTRLTRSGAIVVSRPGTVIDAKDVTGGIWIKANNVTVKRSRVRCGDCSWIIRVDDGTTGVMIQDTEIDGLNGKPGSNAIGWTGFTALRVNLHGVEDGIRVFDNVVVRDSWCHDLYEASTSHNDCIQSTGGRHIQILHNNLDHRRSQTSAILLKSDFGPIDDVKVDNNLLDGGAWTVYSRIGKAAYGAPTNVRFTNNKFGRDGLYGIKSFDGSVVWTGNVWASTGLPIL